MTTTRQEGAQIVSHLINNPSGLTWRELADHLGYALPGDARALQPGWHRLRKSIEHARETAKMIGRVIPRPVLENDYRYRLETTVGNDPSGVSPGTFGSWLHTREDHITRLRTLIAQAETLVNRDDLDADERRHLQRQLTKDRGSLVTLEDELTSFRDRFINGHVA